VDGRHFVKLKHFIHYTKCIKIIDVKTPYVAFRFFHLGSEIFRALPFLRNANSADVLPNFSKNTENSFATISLIRYFHFIQNI